MALVNYGSDSEVESGDEALSPKVSEAQPKKTGLFASLPAPASQNASFGNQTTEKRPGLFGALPPPKSAVAADFDKPKKKDPVVFTVNKPAEVCEWASSKAPHICKSPVLHEFLNLCSRTRTMKMRLS
jgi:hypothetical protein